MYFRYVCEMRGVFRYLWEVWSLFRRFVFCALAVLAQNYPQMQVMAGLLFVMCCAILQVSCGPWPVTPMAHGLWLMPDSHGSMVDGSELPNGTEWCKMAEWPNVLNA